MGGTSRVYIDTSLLLALIFMEAGREAALRTLYRLRSNSFEVVVPQVVLGEIVAVILAKVPGHVERTECFTRLHQIFSDNKIDVKACLPHMPDGALEIEAELRRRDVRITGNDRKLASHVLADPDAKFLLTEDMVLLDNNVIIRFSEELRDEGRRDEKLEIKSAV